MSGEIEMVELFRTRPATPDDEPEGPALPNTERVSVTHIRALDDAQNPYESIWLLSMMPKIPMKLYAC